MQDSFILKNTGPYIYKYMNGYVNTQLTYVNMHANYVKVFR